MANSDNVQLWRRNAQPFNKIVHRYVGRGSRQHLEESKHALPPQPLRAQYSFVLPSRKSAKCFSKTSHCARLVPYGPERPPAG